MGYFEIVRLVILVLFILESWAKMPDEQGDKKHVVMYHPKPHQSGKFSRKVFLYQGKLICVSFFVHH